MRGQLLQRVGDRVVDGAGDQREAGRVALRRPVLRLVVRRVGRQVEHQLHEVGAGDAVDHAVVDLGDERPAVVGQALDQPQLPQRLGHVQPLAEDAAGEVAQLLVAARARAPRCAGRGTGSGSAGRRPTAAGRAASAPAAPAAGSAAPAAACSAAAGRRRRRRGRGPRRRPPTPRASGCSRSPRRRSSHRGRSSGPRSAPSSPRSRCWNRGRSHVVGWPLKLGVSSGTRNLNAVRAPLPCPGGPGQPACRELSSTRSRSARNASSTTSGRVRLTLCPAPGTTTSSAFGADGLGDLPAVRRRGQPVVRRGDDGDRHPAEDVEGGLLVVVEEGRVERHRHRVGRLLQQVLHQTDVAEVGVVRAEEQPADRPAVRSPCPRRRNRSSSGATSCRSRR